MKILAVADKADELVYGPNIRKYFGDVDIVLSCGDLPYEYLEYIVTMLGVPVFFVRGNHDREYTHTMDGIVPAYPGGCVDLNGRVVRHNGLLLAGLEGSQRYKPGPYQHTEFETELLFMRMWPRLLLNKLRWGRYLDVLLTHAAPLGIHDQPDLCHRGFRSIRRFMERYRPRYLIHGHIHLYGHNQPWYTLHEGTHIINAFGYRVIQLQIPSDRHRG